MLADLEAASSQNVAQRLDEEDAARDDRRRAVGMKAGHRAALLLRHRGEPVADRLASPPRHDVAVDASRSRTARARCSIAATDVAVPATAIIARARARAARPGRARAKIARGLGGERVQLRRAAAGRGGCGARSGARRRPGSRRGSARSAPSPTISSVDPPPMSSTTSGPRRPARPLVAPRYASRASSSPAIVRACETVVLAHAAREVGAVVGVAHRARQHRGRRRHPARRVDRARYSSSAANTRAMRLVGQAARCGRRRRRAASRCCAGRARRPRRSTGSTSAISSRVEFVPMSTTATLIAQSAPPPPRLRPGSTCAGRSRPDPGAR